MLDSHEESHLGERSTSISANNSISRERITEISDGRSIAKSNVHCLDTVGSSMRSALDREFKLSLQQFSDDWSAKQEAILKRFCMDEIKRIGSGELDTRIGSGELDTPKLNLLNALRGFSRKKRKPVYSEWSNLTAKRKVWMEGAQSCTNTIGWQRFVKSVKPDSARIVHGGVVAEYRKFLRKLLKSEWYSALYAIIVLVDMAVALWDSELASHVTWDIEAHSSVEIKEKLSAMIVSDVLCAYFLFDLLLRLLARRSAFFTKSLTWSTFQTFSVIAYSVEVVMQHSSYDYTSSARTVTHQIALIRLLRLVDVVLNSKLTNMYNAPIFQDVRLLFYAVSASLSTALSAIGVVLYLCFVAGLIFAQGYVGLFRQEHTLTREQMSKLKHAFGTPRRSIFSVYKTITGGLDWDDVYAVVQNLGWGYQAAFLFFQLFAFIVLLNVVNAVFVDRTLERSKSDRRYMANTAWKSSRDFLESMQNLYSKLDTENKNCIEKEDFKKRLQDQKIGAYFHSLGIDTTQADNLFAMLDVDGSGTVTEEEFMFGCLRLKGEARSLDVAVMQHFMKMMHHDMCEGFKLIFKNASDFQSNCVVSSEFPSNCGTSSPRSGPRHALSAATFESFKTYASPNRVGRNVEL